MKGRNNSSVVKISTAWDVGRVRNSRRMCSRSHHRRLLTQLRSHQDALHNQHQNFHSSAPNSAFYFISQFTLYVVVVVVGFGNKVWRWERGIPKEPWGCHREVTSGLSGCVEAEELRELGRSKGRNCGQETTARGWTREEKEVTPCWQIHKLASDVLWHPH